MRNLLTCLLITLLTFGLVVNDASAKRFGGGRSFGVQRSKSSLFSSSPVQNVKPMNQRANASKWGGVLGGLLVGGLLASLFMGHGLTTGLISWLIVGAIVFFLVNLFRRKMQPGFQAGAANYNPFNRPNQFYSGAGASEGIPSYPAGFVAETFLRDAKVQFIRLQAAYDQKNLQDLSAFTAPEVFSEIKMQLEERGDEPNKTEVLQLDAELLDVSKQADSYLASVRFTGSVNENGEINQLDEIWHFRQFYRNDTWVVAGIQQDVHEV